MKTRETKSYKINSIRIPEYDYSAENYCIVTICSFQKEKIFSEIMNDKVYLTDIGKIIKKGILNAEYIRQNIITDENVIMTNHIHAIIVLNSQVCATKTTHRVVFTTERIDISHLPRGVYFVRVGEKVEKFVKM